MNKKLMVGIDINEVLRAKWFQFDKYYGEEFGENGVPKEQPYVYDFFKYYGWKDTVETTKDLKEPKDMPENISPIDYQINDKLKEAPADTFLFKKPEKNMLTAKEVYNRFMYEDYCFEIHATAPMMYKGMDLHVKTLYLKYHNSAEFTVLGKENQFSIPPTLFFLSKIVAQFKNYHFVDNSLEMWNNVDVLITTDPEILNAKIPWGKILIKLKRPYNENIKVGSLEIQQIGDLIDNHLFEKIIKYKK
jgi:hypothetical protein